MHIDKDHLYYGAAVIQIAEDEHYTSINQFSDTNGTTSQKMRCAYVVNHDTGVYLKYLKMTRRSTWDNKATHEYVFQFSRAELNKIELLATRHPKCFIGMICIESEEIICLSKAELDQLIAARLHAAIRREATYSVVVAIFSETKDRPKVYVTPPHTKNKYLGEPLIIPANLFPRKLFT